MSRLLNRGTMLPAKSARDVRDAISGESPRSALLFLSRSGCSAAMEPNATRLIPSGAAESVSRHSPRSANTHAMPTVASIRAATVKASACDLRILGVALQSNHCLSFPGIEKFDATLKRKGLCDANENACHFGLRDGQRSWTTHFPRRHYPVDREH